MTGKMPRKARDKGAYVNYLKKAREFREAMNHSMSRGNYDAASLSGIHSVISSVDALLTFRHGVVSSGPNHEDAVGLMLELIRDDDAKSRAKHALAVIKMKNLVEYMDTRTSPRQAHEIAKHVERFFSWVEAKLPRAG